MAGDIRSDVLKASPSFFLVAIFLTLSALFSFLSPLTSGINLAWEESVLRAIAHFLPVLPPVIVGLAMRYQKVWAWYVGLLLMAGMFGLGAYLSVEHLVYILYGNFVPPMFLILSMVSIPSLYLLLRGRMRLLKQLRGRDE